MYRSWDLPISTGLGWQSEAQSQVRPDPIHTAQKTQDNNYVNICSYDTHHCLFTHIRSSMSRNRDTREDN